MSRERTAATRYCETLPAHNIVDSVSAGLPVLNGAQYQSWASNTDGMCRFAVSMPLSAIAWAGAEAVRPEPQGAQGGACRGSQLVQIWGVAGPGALPLSL